MDFQSLLHQCVETASKISDGHFTLLKFTTNWRAGFFTPMTGCGRLIT